MADSNDDDRRKSERHDRVERITLKPVESPSDGVIDVEPVSCPTVDISASGICLRSHDPIEIDSTVELCAKVLGNPIRYYLKGAVVRCEQVEGGFVVGVKLDERPGADMLGWQALFD